jgi:hypothetical protein
MIDPRKLFEIISGEYQKTSQPLKERASVLPLGQYEDGSVGLAWPGLLAAPAEGVANFGSQGFGEDAVPYNSRMAFDAAGGAMTGGLGLGLAGGMADNALGSAGAKLTQSASDLPMDLASRMARAREMGFADDVLYHGTPRADFDAFDISKAGLRGGHDGEVWLTSSPDNASSYATNAAGGYNEGSGVLPLRVRGADNMDFWDMGGGSYSSPGVQETMQQALDEARKAGRSGVAFQRLIDGATPIAAGGAASRNAPTVVAMFDPKNIRSVNAAFDPSKSDSANLLAANAKSGSAVPLAIDAAERQPQGSKMFNWSSKGLQEAKIGDAEVTYGVNPTTKTAELTLLRVPDAKRGQGQARAALNVFVQEADANGYTLTLNADPLGKGGLSKAALEKFYKSAGFIRNKGRNKDFTTQAEYIRPPKLSANAPTGASIPAGIEASQDTDPSLLEYLRLLGIQ